MLELNDIVAVDQLSRALQTLFVLGKRRAGDKCAAVAARVEVVEDLLQFVDQRSVTGEVLDFFVRNDHAANGFRKVDQERRIAHVVLGNGGLVVTNCGEVLSAPRAKDRKATNSIADHRSTVFGQDRVKDPHEIPLYKHVLLMKLQLIVSLIY